VSYTGGKGEGNGIIIVEFQTVRINHRRIEEPLGPPGHQCPTAEKLHTRDVGGATMLQPPMPPTPEYDPLDDHLEDLEEPGTNLLQGASSAVSLSGESCP
jgi:hypothetical protein